MDDKLRIENTTNLRPGESFWYARIVDGQGNPVADFYDLNWERAYQKAEHALEVLAPVLAEL